MRVGLGLTPRGGLHSNYRHYPTFPRLGPARRRCKEKTSGTRFALMFCTFILTFLSSCASLSNYMRINYINRDYLKPSDGMCFDFPSKCQFTSTESNFSGIFHS